MKIMVIRFSALGDLVLTLPVIQEVIQKNPTAEIHLLTKDSLAFVAEGIPNLRLIRVKFSSGILGALELLDLCWNLRKMKFDLVVDLHFNLRSRIITGLLKFNTSQYFRVDKGSSEKAEYILHKEINTKPLKHHWIRYAEVFDRAGLNCALEAKAYTNHRWAGTREVQYEVESILKEHQWISEKKIGIAAFSKHPLKEWPLERIEEFLSSCIGQGYGKYIIFLFGAGERENQIFQKWKLKFPSHLFIVKEYFSPLQELSLMNHLEIMLTMDSANLHMANLAGTPKIISIWGPTDPNLGFGPVDLDRNIMIQIPRDQLSCRPCSIFGQKPCIRKDHACMMRIQNQELLREMGVQLKDPSY